MVFNMSKAAAVLSVFAVAQVARAAEVHGSGAQGTVMGPVAFLWPSDRPWSASADNVGPCGSSDGVSNRTDFPIGSMGSIELTIADEAYNVAIRVAYGNDASTQDAFQTIKSNVSKLEPGHQCYSVPSPGTAVAGSNATIQLEYWASDSNKNESFFACADIKFVEVALFTTQVPCFNVTSSEFVSPSSSPSASATASPSATATPSVVTAGGSTGGLSGGAKAGIAVGVIGGVALIAGALFMVLRRKRQAKKDVEEVSEAKLAGKPVQRDTASIGSADTAH